MVPPRFSKLSIARFRGELAKQWYSNFDAADCAEFASANATDKRGRYWLMGSENERAKMSLAGEYPYDANTLNYYMKFFSEWMGAPSNLLQSIAMKESSYNPVTGQFRNVCNWVGACGLMQLRPIAIEESKRLGFNLDPLDPIQSIVGAVILFYKNDQYMASRIPEQMITWPVRIVAYNGGWTHGVKFAQTGTVPTKEGYDYLAFVAPRTGLI